MKKFLLNGVAFAMLAISPAMAADMAVKASPMAPPVSAYNWTGLYLGINGGGGWLRDAEPVGGIANHNGGLIGVTLGYNFYVNPSWIVGLEGDIGYFSHSDHKYLGTARVRVGYAAGRLMPYITYGLAVMQDAENQFPGETNAGARFGATIGAGLEYAITQNISVKGEYLYLDTTEFNGDGPYGSIVRAGLNWRF
jgi:outer membrane immunogenic protein